MRALFLRYGLKHHFGHKFRLLMVLLSLALGVAIFVSSYESVVAAQDAITASATAMSSSAEWEVSRGRYLGVEASLLPRIRALPGAIAAPVIEATVVTLKPAKGSLLVIGLDLDSDASAKLYRGKLDSDLLSFVKLRLSANGILLTGRFAATNHLQEGADLTLLATGGAQTFNVAGVVTDKKLDAMASGNLAFMDVHQVESSFGKPGIVDRIEVAGVGYDKLKTLCPSCQIEKPGQLSSAAYDAIGRIKSLLGVSVIALLVGVLLIYNTVQVSVLERLKDIAILRSIGATRIQVFALLLTEWFVIGVIGSSLGLIIGSGLAVALVEYTKRTVNTMVPLVGEAHVVIGPMLIGVGFFIGIGTALVAAFFPVWAAANVHPLEILRPYSYRRAHRYTLVAIIGAVIFLGSNLFVATQSVAFEVGIAITGGEFLGMALLFPLVVLVIGKWLRKLLTGLKMPGPFLALDSLLKSPHRTAFTIMTFGCALMMTIATETLVGGFQKSMGTWMNSAFPFDLSVMGNDLASSVYGNQVLQKALVDKLRGVKGVRDAYAVRKLFTPFRGQDVMAIGADIPRYLQARRDKKMEMWPPQLQDPAVLRQFRAGEGAFVSDNFAELFGIKPGQMLVLDTPTGQHQLRVLGEVDDYSWSHGGFILDLGALEQYWKDDAISYIDLSVVPGYGLADVKSKVQMAASGDRAAFVYDRHEIKEVTDSVLDQTVAMANLQAAIAIFIGVLGMVNAIWIGVMNRKREIALWRAIGVTRRQIGLFVLYEGLFVSLVAALVGAIGGLYGGWVPLRAFSFEATGYLYPLVVPWPHLIFIVTLAQFLGLAAGLIPARNAANLPILDSIGYE